MAVPSPYEPGKVHTIPARSGIAVPLKKSQTLRVVNTHGTQVVDFWCFASSSNPNPSVSSTSSSSSDAIPLAHHLSMPHTRASTNRLSPIVGDVLTTNQRQPILTLLSDTSPGVHDTLIAACDIWRYRELAHKTVENNPEYYHANCADNCRNGLLALAKTANLEFSSGGGDEAVLGGHGVGAWLASDKEYTPPAPLNLWMNIPVHEKGGEETTGVRKEVSPSCGATLSFERPVSKKGDEVVFRAERDCVAVMSCCPQDLLEINCREPVECAFEVRDA
jgi:uncharacterized protein